jgi:hypothetical protein
MLEKGHIHGSSVEIWQFPVKLKFKDSRRHRGRFGNQSTVLWDWKFHSNVFNSP